MMLGVSLGARLLRGVGGRRGQFGARGVSEGSAAMAAGESMAQRMVWVDLEVRECGRAGRVRGGGRRFARGTEGLPCPESSRDLGVRCDR